jgi:hypothetical protein
MISAANNQILTISHQPPTTNHQLNETSHRNNLSICAGVAVRDATPATD